MCQKEAAERIVLQGNCEGIPCKDCPLNVEMQDANYDCSNRGDVVTQAKIYLEKRKVVYVHKD